MNNNDLNCLVLSDENMSDDYLYEFLTLLRTAHYSPVKVAGQKVKEVNAKTYFGIGKIEEINAILQENRENIDVIATNFDLTALQQKTLSDYFKVEVVDRSFVILKIFELNAKTKEAKLQVEIAKFNYLKSRLINDKASYSQVTSGSKHNKGEGEKKIELTRRKIDQAIHLKEQQLEEIRKSRSNMRKSRNESIYPKIVVVGYTNAGKSTLLNRILEFSHTKSEKMVLSQDALFATLETSTRLIESFEFPSFFITDTVGFVSNLPSYLVDAFKSTLEEIREADLILEVVDISSPNYEDEIKATQEVLDELSVSDVPILYLFNKSDKLVKLKTTLLEKNQMYTSLKDDKDVYDILTFLWNHLTINWTKQNLLLPYASDFYKFKKENYVIRCSTKEDGHHCLAFLNPLTLYLYKDYFFNEE